MIIEASKYLSWNQKETRRDHEWPRKSVNIYPETKRVTQRSRMITEVSKYLSWNKKETSRDDEWSWKPVTIYPQNKNRDQEWSWKSMHVYPETDIDHNCLCRLWESIKCLFIPKSNKETWQAHEWSAKSINIYSELRRDTAGAQIVVELKQISAL